MSAPSGSAPTCDRGSRRRRIREVLGVDRVHAFEVAEIGHEDRHLDDPVEAGAGSFENGADVVEHPSGLIFDGTRDQGSGGGVEGHLARR